MTEGLPTTFAEPPPGPRQSRVGLVALAAVCASLGGMLGGSAVGVLQAGQRPTVSVQVVAPSPDGGTALTSQEANPESAGDGVMDDLDEAPSDAGAAVTVEAPTEDVPTVVAVIAAGAALPSRRRDGSVVTSDDVPEGSAQGFIEGRAVRITVTRLDAKPVEVHTAAAYTRMCAAAARSAILSM